MSRTVIALLGLVVGAVLALGGVWALDDDPPGDGYGHMRGTDRTVEMMGGSGSGSGSGSMASGVMGVDSEADYLAAMVPHHEEAIAAARELARSERPELRELGASIVASQTAQVEQMHDWLARWHPDAPGTSYEPMMRDLSDLDGDALDEAFLTDMVAHHMVAVMMSQRLLIHGDVEHDEVADLARDISTEQRREIALMRGWLLDGS